MNTQAIETQISRYLNDKKLLIVEPSPSVRASMIGIFKELGIRDSFIYQVSDHDDAIKIIEKIHIHLMVCDFNLQGKSGLGLIQYRNQKADIHLDLLSVILMRNSKESAIADAIEEDVDSIILKPFTAQSFKNHMIKMILTKMNLDPYGKAIEKGKIYFNKGFLTQAKETFQLALLLHKKPVLAHYYLGKVSSHLGRDDEAKGFFESGLKFDPESYKCLTGLFQLYFRTQNDKSAYQIAKRILGHFPISTRRLAELLSLMQRIQQFDEIEILYRAYLGTDLRDPGLIQTLISTLISAGKYYLEVQEPARALTLFKKSMISSGRSMVVFQELINLLLQFGYVSEAYLFLNEIPPAQKSEPEFRSIDFQIMNQTQSASEVFEHGQKLLKEGIKKPNVYEILITRAKELGKNDLAEDLVYEASKSWPEHKNHFVDVLKIPTLK